VEGDNKTTQGELRIAKERIGTLENGLEAAVREKDELAMKVGEQKKVIEGQRKELDEIKMEFERAKTVINTHKERLVIVGRDATKAVGGLKRVEKDLNRDLPELIFASARHTEDIKNANTNLAALSKKMEDEIKPALDAAKKGLEIVSGTVKDVVTPTIDAVEKSIEDLQNENEGRDLKLNQLSGSVTALEKTVQADQEIFIETTKALKTSIDEVGEDIQLARESLSRRIQSTDESLEKFMDRGVSLRQGVDDAKQQIGIAKTDIEDLRKTLVVRIEEVNSLVSFVPQKASRNEDEVTQLKAEVKTQINAYGKKQVKTEKRLQDHGNKIEGHGRQLNDIHLILRSLNADVAVAIPNDKSRSGRQQKRDAAKKSKEEASEIDEAENEVSLLPLRELVIHFSEMQREGDCNVAMLQLLELAITLRLAAVMERRNSRMTVFSLRPCQAPGSFLPSYIGTFCLQPPASSVCEATITTDFSLRR
jgi:chromosome segregation ATPase